MAKLIINENIVIKCESMFEGRGKFSASGHDFPEELKPLIKGIEATSYRAEFDNGEEYPIYGEYTRAYATTNGTDAEPPYKGFSVSLENE